MMPNFLSLSYDQVRTFALYNSRSGLKPTESYNQMRKSFGDDVTSKIIKS